MTPDDIARELGVSVGAVLDGSVNDPAKLAEEQREWERRMDRYSEPPEDCGSDF